MFKCECNVQTSSLTFLRLMIPSLVSLSVAMENVLAPSELMMLYFISALMPRSSSLALIFPTGFPTWADSGTYSSYFSEEENHSHLETEATTAGNRN